MTNNFSYSDVEARLRAFAAGHYIIKRYSVGESTDFEQTADPNESNAALWPLMHVIHPQVTLADGEVRFDLEVLFADLPREIEGRNFEQVEVLSNLVRLCQDLMAAIKNKPYIFSDSVSIESDVTIETIGRARHNSVCVTRLTATVALPYDWNACDIPADFVFGQGSGGDTPWPWPFPETNDWCDKVVYCPVTQYILAQLELKLESVAVDGITITGDGTPGNPLVALGGGGGGAVDSVNGQTGVVVLDAGDVGADPAGSAAAAETNANAYTDNAIAGLQFVESVDVTADGDAISPTGGPITSSGAINLEFNGAATDYIDGEGNLQAFPAIPTGTVESVQDGYNTDVDSSDPLNPIVNASITRVNQTAHGLTVGKFVRFGGGVFRTSQGNSSTGGESAQVWGRVIEVIDADNLVVQSGGVTKVAVPSTVGVYYIDPANAGDVTMTQPNAPNFSSPVMFVTKANEEAIIIPIAEASLNERVATVASASFTNLSVLGRIIEITGTTTINSFGTIGTDRNEKFRVVFIHFTDVLQITHGTGGANNISLPNNANITTTAGDHAIFVYDDVNSLWRCVNYMRADGSSLTGGGAPLALQTNGTPNGSQTLLNLAAGSNITLTDNGTGTVTVASQSVSQQDQFYSNQAIPSGATRYIATHAQTSTIGTSVAAVESPVPLACTYSKAYFSTANAQPGTGSLVLTLLVNGSQTALVVTVAAGSSAGSFSDLVNTVSVSAGQFTCWEAVNNASANSAQIRGSVFIQTI